MTTENPTLSNWTDGRLNGCAKYLADDFFTGKNILEVGYNYPSAGPKLAALGATVTIYDLSQSNLDAIKAIHPDLNTELVDLATDTVHQKYDVIWDTNVIDILSDPVKHLQDVCTNCDYLILDAWVLDSNDSDITFILQNGEARVTAKFVDDTLQSNGFESIMPIDTVFDAESRSHGWEPQNDNECRENNCRIWIAWRSTVSSPLKPAPVPEVAPEAEPVPEYTAV
jgi:hypothetical protein